jgi:REP element-mobilizing transposase RayT
MPRTRRLVNGEEKTAYHVMSRTALDGFPFGDVEKDELVKIIKKFSKLFFVEVFGFSIMGNHFHLLIQMFPEHHYKDEEIRKRCKAHYGEEFEVFDEQIGDYRVKLSSLANYMKEIKQAFSWYYNQRHNRRGTLWGERFKSVIVENGETLINCLAYIDLNPLRAGLVKRPEDYRWNSIGYHVQTGNKDNFLSLDLGPGEIRSAVTSELHWAGLKEFGFVDTKERLKRYRRYVYEAGAINRPDKMQAKVIGDRVLEKERKRAFELSRNDRFRYRTRYFTDSGVIGSKEFVTENYQRFKYIFSSKHEKKPKPIKGLDGMYSLKRLSEVI